MSRASSDGVGGAGGGGIANPAAVAMLTNSGTVSGGAGFWGGAGRNGRFERGHDHDADHNSRRKVPMARTPSNIEGRLMS
jgi:hypothetical protein